MISIRFGTSKVVDLSDGQFPVEVWRVHIMHNGTREERHWRTSTTLSTLQRGIDYAGHGWRAGSVDSWVELRTPEKRLKP